MKTFFAIIISVAVAVPLTWFAARRLHPEQTGGSAASQSPSERKVLYYQSAMHPWIKSDKPGRCTICGMELTPVYEGEPGGDVVPLSQTMIQVMNVQTAEAQVRPLTKTLTVAGMIDDDATKHRVLSAYIPGRIEKLHVNYMGAEVRAGQPLADFYSPALLQTEREYRSLTGELRQAVGLRLRQMGLTPEQISALPNKPADKLTSEILSPVSGTVVGQNVYEGQYVQEGEKLLEIADFSTMWFVFRAYEQDLPWIKPGLKVEITAPSHPSFVYTGQVAFIDPTLDEATRSARVRVELPNPPPGAQHRMLHKLYADAAVHVETPEVLTVPRSAVLETGPEAVVYVEQSGGHYARRPIKLGMRGDTVVEVLAGLAAGEKVVVNGNLLIDGQAEMNRAFSPEHSEGPMSAVPLTDAQKRVIETFVRATDAVSAALAKDDLTQFNAAGPEVMKATETVSASLKESKELADILTHLMEARHLHEAKDLAAARKMFHPFSNAAARLLQFVQFPDPAPFELFECPMVDRAIPGVPKKGRWVQVAGREIGNPYFGAEMLDCGEKVKR